jgi:hypothetical protein
MFGPAVCVYDGTEGESTVNAVKATWTNGQILPGEPIDWPEGSELVVEPVGTGEKAGLDESEWRDDTAALADWDAWLRTIQPRVLTDEERATFAAYEEEVRRHNLDAMRRQMDAGDGA